MPRLRLLPLLVCVAIILIVPVCMRAPGGFYRSTPRDTMVMLQGRGAGLSLSGKPVLGPAGSQGSPGSPGTGPVCLGALFAVLLNVTEWPG